MVLCSQLQRASIIFKFSATLAKLVYGRLEYGGVDSALIEVLKGECQIEQREFLECEYEGNSFSAFNEIVLHTQKSYKLIEFEVK